MCHNVSIKSYLYWQTAETLNTVYTVTDSEVIRKNNVMVVMCTSRPIVQNERIKPIKNKFK